MKKTFLFLLFSTCIISILLLFITNNSYAGNLNHSDCCITGYVTGLPAGSVCTQCYVEFNTGGKTVCTVYCDSNCFFQCCNLDQTLVYGIEAYYGGYGCGVAPCYCPGKYNIPWCFNNGRQYNDPIQNKPILDSNCNNGIYYDSTGTFQTEYGITCGPAGWVRWVMKITPSSYPYTINKVCIALSRSSSGSQVWEFNIDFFDTTGSNGGPGNLVDSIPVAATPVPIWPNIFYFNFSNLSGIPALTHGSYYIGISYDPCVSSFHYIPAVESGVTQRPGYLYSQGYWQPIQYLFTNYKVLGIRAEQVPVGIINSNNKIPVAFKLYYNYPNPFNPNTAIKFDLPQATDIKLIVYNNLGQEITTLINEHYQAGSYSVTWDGINYPSGVYFYKIEAGNYTDTKKMVLIK